MTHLTGPSIRTLVHEHSRRCTNSNSPCSSSSKTDCSDRRWCEEKVSGHSCSDGNGSSSDDDRVRVHASAVVAAYRYFALTVLALEDVFVEALCPIVPALFPWLTVGFVDGEVPVEVTGCTACLDTYLFIAARYVLVDAAFMEIPNIAAFRFAAV